jgi:type I restriction enzyme S subunit
MEKKFNQKYTVLPNGWEVKQLIEIADYVDYRGKTPDKKNCGKFLVTAKNIRKGLIDYQISQEYISEDDYSTVMSRGLPIKGDILITTEAPLGSVAMIDREDIALAQRVIKYRTKDETSNNYYLFHYLQSDYFQQILDLKSTGSTAKGIKGSTLHKLPILLPPLPEQRAIANILSTWDTAIQTTQALISQKKQEKKWLMQNLLTGNKRLKGFENINWKKVGAGDVFESFTKKGFENEELLSATQDRGIIPRSMLEGRVTMPDGSTSGYKLVVPGDFIISLRSFQGGLEYSYYRGIVSPAYIVLKPKLKINDEFYKQYFKSYEFIGRLATAVIGIRDGKQISYDDFCIVKIPNPSIEEQTAIAQVLQTADKEIELLKTKLEQQKLQKKGLMQVLLTGKVRVKI